MKFKKVQENSGSDSFLKLKDKQSVVGVFVGEPYEFYSVFENQQQREVPDGTAGAKFRFRLNFIMKDGQNLVPKIFENSAKVYRQLDEINHEYDGLDTIYVKITRNGEKLETTYSILPSKMPLTAEEIARIKALKLHVLKPAKESASKHDLNESNYDPAAFFESEEIPF
jgi:hypothetical protein